MAVVIDGVEYIKKTNSPTFKTGLFSIKWDNDDLVYVSADTFREALNLAVAKYGDTSKSQEKCIIECLTNEFKG
jgi:hypothetical protein